MTSKCRRHTRGLLTSTKAPPEQAGGKAEKRRLEGHGGVHGSSGPQGMRVKKQPGGIHGTRNTREESTRRYPGQTGGLGSRMGTQHSEPHTQSQENAGAEDDRGGPGRGSGPGG